MEVPTTIRKLKKPNSSWVRPFQDGEGSLYQQISNQIINAVHDGVLRPGDRLPPQRELAQAMGVDLTTVTRAYAEVRAAGLMDAYGAGGSYISCTHAEDHGTVDLSMNTPPLLGSALFSRMMLSAMSYVQKLMSNGDFMSYRLGAGLSQDRQAAAVWLKPMLSNVDGDRIVICSGAQAALSALLLARTQPDDVVVVDSLTHPGFLAAIRVLQRRVVTVPADAEGMLPDELEKVCRENKPSLLYLVPTIHNPTTATMSQARREAIYKVIKRHDVAVIEDDPYWLLAGDAAPPIAALGLSDRSGPPVFYVSTLSKCLAPGLRTAYLVVPPSEPIEPILDALRSLSLMPAQSMVSSVTHWIQEGAAQEWMRQIRQDAGQRQKIAANILPGKPIAHPYGLHLWLELSPKLDQYRLIQTAQEQGLGVTSSDVFCPYESSPGAIRIALGGAPDHARLQVALEKLSDILLSADKHQRIAAIV